MALGMPPAVLYLRRSRFAPKTKHLILPALVRLKAAETSGEKRVRGGHEPAKPADNIHQVMPWG